MQHDRYDNDILKQLTRIANALENINKKMSSIPESPVNNHTNDSCSPCCATCINKKGFCRHIMNNEIIDYNNFCCSEYIPREV